MERQKGKRLIPFVRNIFIPVTHVLEYREYWEDIENYKIGTTFAEEYPGFNISSIRNFKGDREYYKRLRKIKEKECIDLVQDHIDREDDPNSIKLSYSEKFQSGKIIKKRNNEFYMKYNNPFKFIMTTKEIRKY